MGETNQNNEICVVCPTIRDTSTMLKRYADNARDNIFDLNRLQFLILTEDFCDKHRIKRSIDEAGVSGEVFNEQDRIEWMKRHDLDAFRPLIPRRSHAETSFGLLWLYSHGFSYGIFIDDDTLPTHEDFFGDHMRNLTETRSVVFLESTSRWVNVLHYSFEQHRLYPRGYPYSKMNETYAARAAQTDRVVVSQGLWTNVPDLDAVRLLVSGNLDGGCSAKLDEKSYDQDFVVADHNYVTLCSMNLAFSAEVVPYFYQLPMDDNSQKIGRFDDIWSGLILKRICDRLHYQFVSGHPLCCHSKAPRNVFSDLKAEVNGLEINEHLGDILDSIELSSGTGSQMYIQLGESLRQGDWSHLQNGSFLNLMGARMVEWTRCCEFLEANRHLVRMRGRD